MNVFNEEVIREIVNGRLDLSAAPALYDSLYDRYSPQMPYGTAKARDGDPYEWILHQLWNDYQHLMED